MYTGRDTGSGDGRSTARPLAAYAYEELKRRLLQGEFRLGGRLAEVALAELLDVSRTPVREALSRLHAEGLVVRLPEGGLTPAAPDLHTVAELYEVRRALEFTALRRGGHDLARLEALRDRWLDIEAPAGDEQCGPDFVLEDEGFHVMLASAAGNQSLADTLAHVNERIRFVRMHDFLTADRVRSTIEEHLGIVEAVLAENGEQADARMAAHLDVSERVVEARAARALSRMLWGRPDA